ncbi:MAG: cell division protease FtsH [Parcubacteria group bacterium Licking1014_17]|nr:MAG: cell division protease FtsH [Parcubacteria group bacterium Licking1014_17]
MRSLAKYISVIILILLVTSALVVVFGSPSGTAPETVSLSKLVTQINAGQVKDITVRDSNLDITLIEGDKKETAQKETESSLSQTLADLGVDKNQLAKVNIDIGQNNSVLQYMGNLLPIVLPFIFVMLIFWYMFRQAQRGTMNAMSFGKTKARLATELFGKKRITFKDVAGLAEAKEEVSEVVEFLRDPTKFRRLGARMPRGVLLVGSPGTGKTLLAKAVANEASVPFHFVSGSEFVEMFVGVGATRVRDTFENAKKTAPAIIFIDEIDAVGRHRGAGLGGGHDEREQTLNQILVEMDGFDTNDAVVVIAATNRPDILDPALLRPGRFDRRIVLDEPSINDREAILKIHSAEKPLADDVNLRVVAERTVGFSGADLANIVNEAAILAARTNQFEITQNNLLIAIEKVMLGPERKNHIFTEKEKKITAYHEAGHALVAASLPNTDPIHKVSIVSRGHVGGYTLKLPSEDKHLRTKSEFESELAVLLGGFSAEQETFKDTTTGASSDLKIASELARRMITEYGMSGKLGPITFGDKEQLVFLGKDIANHQNYSNEIAYQIDQEVKNMIDAALKRAGEIISKKIDLLKKIAEELLQKETLEQAEFYALVNA